MSLPVSEERALTDIEQALLHRDPRLKSLFAIFTRLTRHEAMPAIEQLRRRRRRWQPSPGAAIVVAIALLVGAIVIGSLGSTKGCGPAQPSASTAARPSAAAPTAPGCSPSSYLRR
jgi:hypothetical protein